MNRCTRCVMPDTRPDVPFTDGVCQACLTYANRPEIDWDGRQIQLLEMLAEKRNRYGYDCIVPSSGGKDSTYQVMKLLELGAKPLVVTATTCHLTDLGRKNIDNLSRHADTIEVTPDRTTRAKLNRLGLELAGDISWPEHVAIFTVPFRIAAQMGIPLIFYGENPQNQYGGPMGTEEAMQLTRRWRAEFGGFLGLRPDDLVNRLGITKRNMVAYQMPDERIMEAFHIQAHFLGQYIPWDSRENAQVAIDAGMVWRKPSLANWWDWENLDNAQTGLHDHLMYRKYGYGRGCAQASVDVRTGVVSRAEALTWVEEKDGRFPHVYAEVFVETALEAIGMKLEEFVAIANRFTNWELFERTDDLRPVLKGQ